MRKSRWRRRGYICIWGTTSKERVTDHEGVIVQCPGCRQLTRMIGKSMTPYCSIYYIPLFPQGGGRQFLQCTRCGGKFNGDAAAIRREQQGRQSRLDSAISEKMRLYHENPADADLACEVVELLAQSDRVDKAMELASSLAQTHSENANVHVMLGRLLLHRGEVPAALEAFRESIQRDPAHAGARFYSAVALLNTKPPRLAEALTFAKQARDRGHPEARNLVQAIEQRQQG